MLMKKICALFVTALVMFNVHAALPYTFSSGGAIRASEINANFTYLNNLVTSKTYIRASRSVSTNSAAQSLYTVATGESQHIITFISVPICNNGGAVLTVGSDSMNLGSSQAQLSGLNIPVNAGESVSISCLSLWTPNLAVLIVLAK